MIDMWQFQATLSRRLAQWAALSTGLGMVMLLRRGFWRGMGGQFVGWAFVNVGIAFFGTVMTDRRRQTLDAPEDPAVQLKEQKSLRRLLWINAGLDILYMLGGLRLRASDKAARSGMGVGIFLQGLFLFGFDVIHALALTDIPSEVRDVE